MAQDPQNAGTQPAVPFEPLYDRVVIEPAAAEKETASGIVIPDAAQERHAEGIVVAKGPGYRMSDGEIQPLRVEIGDRVIYGKYGGTSITIGDHDDLVILSERDIHGIWRGSE